MVSAEMEGLGLILSGDAEISLKTCVFGTTNRAVLEGCVEAPLVHVEQLVKARSLGQTAWCEGGFACMVCAQVEWADVEAIVASKDVMAHPGRQFIRNLFPSSTKFDCQIGDAAVGVDDVGLDDGAGWTGLNTEGAASAKICARLVRRQVQCRENFSQQQPRTPFGRHEVGVFPDPAETRLLGPGFFHNRSCVDVGSRQVSRRQI